MFKPDKIFYAACGLCAIGLVLALMGYELAILLFVAAYLLRPALHESGLARQYADERQIIVHSRSGNIAFIVLLLALVGFSLWRVSRGERAEELYELIIIGLASRAIAGLVMGGEYRKAGATIIGAIGVFLGLFIILEAGLSWGALAGVVIAGLFVGIAKLALWYPRVVATILILIVAGSILFFDLYEFRSVQTALWLFFVTPLVCSAACLLLGGGGEEKMVSPHLRTTVFTSLAVGAAIVFALLILFGDRGNEDRLGGSTRTADAGAIVEIQGVPCSGMIDTYSNGKLESCALAHDATVNGQELPGGTVVTFTPEGDFDWCFLQQTTEIQDHLCRGSGHNFMTCFHPNGILRLAWLAEDEIIDGIPCAKWHFMAIFSGTGGGTHFHDNGRLRLATLSKGHVIEGRTFKRNSMVEFDREGRLVAPAN